MFVTDGIKSTNNLASFGIILSFFFRLGCKIRWRSNGALQGKQTIKRKQALQSKLYKNLIFFFAQIKSHSIVYHVDVPGSKFSHAIYTSYMTGQLPTNYNGDPIPGDHLVRSMKRSPKNDYRFNYVGPEWSFLAIFGKQNYATFFEETRIERESLDINFVHPYPFFFEYSSTMSMTNYLEELKRKDQSMFAHTGVFDHRQHGEHRGLGPEGENFPHTDNMARILNTDMKSLKNWIDQNPRYVLLLVSDHGVDEYGLAGIVI